MWFTTMRYTKIDVYSLILGIVSPKCRCLKNCRPKPVPAAASRLTAAEFVLAEWETGLGLLSTRCGSKSAIHSASLVRAYLHR